MMTWLPVIAQADAIEATREAEAHAWDDAALTAEDRRYWR